MYVCISIQYYYSTEVNFCKLRVTTMISLGPLSQTSVNFTTSQWNFGFKTSYRVVPFIVSIFLKTLSLLHFLMELSEFLVCYFWRLIYECYFMIFFKILTISGQKRQICEHTLKFLANFCAAPMNLAVFV